ncbi:MAG: sugar ABC transporter permease [Cyanobacteria bacterium]|nr:sugar ABC transporter permease [Cyanobacteriota bacterium]
MLTKIGLGFFAIDWFGNPRFSLYSIIMTIIWKSVGFTMILFLARLTTIDYSIYEAAKIDGASDMQIFRYISIPMLKNIIQIAIVLQLISLTSFLFNYIYVMTQGGPGFSSTVLEYFIYINAFKYQDIGISSASGLFLILITGFLVYFYLFTNKKQER